MWVQVHMTQGDYDGKAVIISWVTPYLHGSDTAYYGTSKGHYTFKAKATNTSYTFSDNSYTSGQIYHCLLDGLEVINNHKNYLIKLANIYLQFFVIYKY